MEIQAAFATHPIFKNALFKTGTEDGYKTSWSLWQTYNSVMLYAFLKAVEDCTIVLEKWAKMPETVFL